MPDKRSSPKPITDSCPTGWCGSSMPAPKGWGNPSEPAKSSSPKVGQSK